eukprot:g11341.t1
MDEFVAKIKPDIEARRVKMENEIRDLATENRAQLTNVQNEIHQRNRKLDSLERQCGELSARVTPFLALNDKCKELKLRLEDKEKECEALKEKCGRLEKQTIRDNNLFFGAVVLLQRLQAERLQVDRKLNFVASDPDLFSAENNAATAGYYSPELFLRDPKRPAVSLRGVDPSSARQGKITRDEEPPFVVDDDAAASFFLRRVSSEATPNFAGSNRLLLNDLYQYQGHDFRAEYRSCYEWWLRQCAENFPLRHWEEVMAYAESRKQCPCEGAGGSGSGGQAGCMTTTGGTELSAKSGCGTFTTFAALQEGNGLSEAFLNREEFLVPGGVGDVKGATEGARGRRQDPTLADYRDETVRKYVQLISAPTVVESARCQVPLE